MSATIHSLPSAHMEEGDSWLHEGVSLIEVWRSACAMLSMFSDRILATGDLTDIRVRFKGTPPFTL